MKATAALVLAPMLPAQDNPDVSVIQQPALIFLLGFQNLLPLACSNSTARPQSS